jgi:hypothetical protein
MLAARTHTTAMQAPDVGTYGSHAHHAAVQERQRAMTEPDHHQHQPQQSHCDDREPNSSPSRRVSPPRPVWVRHPTDEEEAMPRSYSAQHRSATTAPSPSREAVQAELLLISGKSVNAYEAAELERRNAGGSPYARSEALGGFRASSTTSLELSRTLDGSRPAPPRQRNKISPVVPATSSPPRGSLAGGARRAASPPTDLRHGSLTQFYSAPRRDLSPSPPRSREPPPRESAHQSTTTLNVSSTSSTLVRPAAPIARPSPMHASGRFALPSRAPL